MSTFQHYVIYNIYKHTYIYNIYIHKYIYIYICVCVCVCVLVNAQQVFTLHLPQGVQVCSA